MGHILKHYLLRKKRSQIVQVGRSREVQLMSVETVSPSSSILSETKDRAPAQYLHRRRPQVALYAKNSTKSKRYNHQPVKKKNYARFQVWNLCESNTPICFEVDPLYQEFFDFLFYTIYSTSFSLPASGEHSKDSRAHDIFKVQVLLVYILEPSQCYRWLCLHKERFWGKCFAKLLQRK